MSKLGKSSFDFFQISSPDSQIWKFWAKKYQLFNLGEILPVSYLESADFKSGFLFPKF